MRLLLTNDDGIDAPGLAELYRVASQWGEVVVVAPKQPWSGCGHRICTDREIEVVQTKDDWWSVDAFPADCVRIALACLVDSVDWVLAGINDGANLGSDIYVSGTVAAAREAALFRRRAIAVSQYRSRGGDLSWSDSGDLANRALQQVFSRPHEPGQLWNINLPDISAKASDTATPQADVDLVDCPVDSHPLPAEYHRDCDTVRYVGNYQSRTHEESTDVHRCFNGAITISSLAIHHP